MSLTGLEFIRRFSLHILPKGFVRIRHYGILSSTSKPVSIPAICNQLPIIEVKQAKEVRNQDTYNPLCCPDCKTETMRVIEIIPTRGPPQIKQPSEKCKRPVKYILLATTLPSNFGACVKTGIHPKTDRQQCPHARVPVSTEPNGVVRIESHTIDLCGGSNHNEKKKDNPQPLSRSKRQHHSLYLVQLRFIFGSIFGFAFPMQIHYKQYYPVY